MRSRGKVLAIESIIVMLVLVLFACVVFLVIDAGTGAYEDILSSRDSAHSARVAYTYISNKIKQYDSAGCVDVVETEYGNTLRLISDEYSTYIFYADGVLYECLTKADSTPKVSSANKITDIDTLEFSRSDNLIRIICTCGSGENIRIAEGTVGLRS